MHHDEMNEFRPLLEKDPPEFVDRVDTPWDQVPDLLEYNGAAYRRIVRDLERIRRDNDRTRQEGTPTATSSRGVLVLGEAGTGKTHLLMRVARNLSESNHILFVRKPNNEEAVAHHVWTNIVNSLSRTLPNSPRSQLDDLLAHVFSDVLIPEFERDVEDDVNVEQRQRWVSLLRADPYNLFLMLGEGEKRQDNLRKIRRRTLRYLQVNHPDVDQRIAHALITYCFVTTPDRKRVLLTWLSGQDIDETEAQTIGLPARWIELTDNSTEVSIQQSSEEQALRAIRTIGILSTHYQPLILAFDQLEGLRGEERLTRRWGDVVREIFTMTPNFLVVTCIFPSLWESWFTLKLDSSTAQRISQQILELERFGSEHAAAMLTMHLDRSFVTHRLPTSIFPFEEDDLARICEHATSPRMFIQKARSLFESWLDKQEQRELLRVTPAAQVVVTQEAVDSKLRTALDKFEKEHRSQYGTEIPIEQDFFGRIGNLIKTFLSNSSNQAEYDKARHGTYVMPLNMIVRPGRGGDGLCLAVMNGVGGAFCPRAKNLLKTMAAGQQFKTVVILRDRRCRQFGPRSQEYAEEIERAGGVFVHAGSDEIAVLNALYDTLVAVEEHDLSVGSHEIGKQQFVQFARSSGVLGKTQFLRSAGKLSEMVGNALGLAPPHSSTPVAPPVISAVPVSRTSSPRQQEQERRIESVDLGQQRDTVSKGVPAQFVIGDTEIDSPHLGVLGRLKDDGRHIAISLTKPQCIVVLGYMGSGKSYSLGVLVENALLEAPSLIRQTRPMTVVAFNYRRNPESRFEHLGFAKPNTNGREIDTLRSTYCAEPQGVKTVNIFGYRQELARRRQEYGDLPVFPITFRPHELGAEHWEILMKPPSPQSEYMDIIRDIIQKLFYDERLTFKNLEKHILTDERLADSQRRRALNRLSFAQRWIADDRSYEWTDVLEEGALNIFDLRMQTLDASEALKLCLIVTDLVRRTHNGVNKVIVFDEAHEYVDCKELVVELENAITQIRHDGLSFILASQFPERIPERIFKYLLTRLIFKLPTAKAIQCVRKAAPNLQALSPQSVSNLDLEQGVCFVQTDDDCSDSLLRVPQMLSVRPRCTQHGGATVRNVGSRADAVALSGDLRLSRTIEDAPLEHAEGELEKCPICANPLVIKRRQGRLFIGCSGSSQGCSYSRPLNEDASFEEFD